MQAVNWTSLVVSFAWFLCALESLCDSIVIERREAWSFNHCAWRSHDLAMFSVWWKVNSKKRKKQISRSSSPSCKGKEPTHLGPCLVVSTVQGSQCSWSSFSSSMERTDFMASCTYLITWPAWWYMVCEPPQLTFSCRFKTRNHYLLLGGEQLCISAELYG